MLELLQTIRTELEMIKKAPWSFAIICVVAVGAIWTLLNYGYKSKLDDAHELTGHWMGESQHWQSDAEYWKDIASRPALGKQEASNPPKEAEPAKPVQSTTESNKPIKTPGIYSPTGVNASASSSPPEQILSAPNGIAVGGGTVTNPTVNNYGQQQRQLTPNQAALISSKLGGPPTSDFDGVYCVMGDSESHAYAQQFWDLFSKANWSVGKMVGQNMLTRNPPGVFIAVSPEDVTSPPDGAIRVYGLFKQAGIDVMALKMEGLPKNHWYVFVGNQPS
jgi:hypothetical protein